MTPALPVCGRNPRRRVSSLASRSQGGPSDAASARRGSAAIQARRVPLGELLRAVEPDRVLAAPQPALAEAGTPPARRPRRGRTSASRRAAARCGGRTPRRCRAGRRSSGRASGRRRPSGSQPVEVGDLGHRAAALAVHVGHERMLVEDRRGRVRGAVVDHDHLVDELGHPVEPASDERLLVEDAGDPDEPGAGRAGHCSLQRRRGSSGSRGGVRLAESRAASAGDASASRRGSPSAYSTSRTPRSS